MSMKRVKIQHLLESQLPSYVREEFPLIDEFFSQYYLGLEFQGGTLDLIRNIDSYIKLNESANITSETQLAADIDNEQDYIDVYNADGFPETFGIIEIDNEIIVYQAKVGNRFLLCNRGFSYINSYETGNNTEEAIFQDTDAVSHKFQAKVRNLSVLFLEEFLKKVKGQFLPGLQTQNLTEGLNEATFIRQSRDFYSTRGTESSFKILFKALYNDNVDIIRPQDFLISPSNASFQLTRDLIVEPLEGDPENLRNMTLFQDQYENIDKAYAPISHVEKISVGILTDVYYKVSIDSSFNKYDGSAELLYGSFSPHASTKLIDKVSVGQTHLDVDSTLGFPDEGELSVTYTDGISGIITYYNKSTTQFYGIADTTIIKEIKDNTVVEQNTYAYGYDTETQTDDGIKVKIRSVLNEFQEPAESYYQTKDSKVKIKSLGKIASGFKANNWISNSAQFYNVKSLTIEEVSNNIYKIVFFDEHTLRIGDLLELTDSNLVARPNDLVVTDVLDENSCLIRGSGVGDPGKIIKVTKRTTKFRSDIFTTLRPFDANVQNTYVRGNDVLVASNSLPAFLNTKVGPNRLQFEIEGTFSLNQTEIPLSAGLDHNFFTGDVVYYTPQKELVQITQPDGTVFTEERIVSQIFPEGKYIVKRVDNTKVKFAKSAANLHAGKFEKVVPAGGVNTVDVIDNTIEKYEFRGKAVQPQKLYREIKEPVSGATETINDLDYSGILVNGVEILNYKSSDFVYYGGLTSIDVTSGGSGYDIINPPALLITDSVGTGATGFCAVKGGLKEIRILDPGFDYVEVPKIKITGGNGSGAKAEANLIPVTNAVSFNAVGLSTLVTGIGKSTEDSTIGFTTYHKFRDGERVVYKTFGETPLTGLTTDATYYVNTIGIHSVRLHNTLDEAIAGINTITISDSGTGVHQLKSYNNKLVVGSINVIDSGSGYENKNRTCTIAGIDTSINTVTINNHDYKTGELVNYTTDGTVVSGLTNDTNYYVTVVNDNQFRLSEVGVGSTAADFYYNTNQYIDFTTQGGGTHSFNYPAITVEVLGKVGISSIAGDEFKASVQPVFRGEVTSITLSAAGSNYGVPDILNFKREPQIDLLSGEDGQLEPVVNANGQIQTVVINRPGTLYNSPPDIIVNGTGQGAEVVAELSGGQITGVKVNKSGIGYGTSTTSISVVASGSNAKFSTNLQQWTVNKVKKSEAKLTSDDVFIEQANSDTYGLQFSYAYAPRELRKIIYSKNQGGDTLYGKKDLQILDDQEVTNIDHSGIIGWSYDGYPIYGPYGYSGVRGGSITQMKSGYVIDLKPNRPPITAFPQEFFIEDFKWIASTDESVLDKNNGRFCVTPDFPNGTYAYFATLESSVAADGVFKNFKKPAFPYLIGESFKSKPNAFNYNINSNQDNYDLNGSDWRRNTTTYALNKEESGYDYLLKPYDFTTQESNIKTIEKGNIDNIGIVTGGRDYRVKDRVIFNDEDGFFTAPLVSKIKGVGVSTVSFAKSEISNIEFYPSTNSKGAYIGISSDPHNFRDGDIVTISGISTTDSLIEGTYVAGISSNRLRIAKEVDTVANTGVVTFIDVRGRDLVYPLIQENDILGIGTGSNFETVKVLNIDTLSSRLRVQRSINGVTGVSHTITTQVEEQPRRFTVNVGYNTTFVGRRNREFYFNPVEALGLGTTAGVGIGTTISFINPGAGVTSKFILTQQLYLPDHGLTTGDELIYNANGGTPIGVGTTSGDPVTQQLLNEQTVFVANLGPDLIGLSTVRVGLGSTGIFAGIGSTVSHFGLYYFHNVGVGETHSLRTNYSNVIRGNIERNLVTVSCASTHGLRRGDTVFLDVNPSISTTKTIRYDSVNKKTTVDSLSFVAAGVGTTTNTINIDNHGLQTGQRVVHEATTPAQGLLNHKEYFVYSVDKDNFRLCDTQYQTKQAVPEFVDIGTQATGDILPVNPPLTFYRNSTVTFDLNDDSLSYQINRTRFPGFVFKLYEDSDYIREYLFDGQKFAVTKSGRSGIDATVTLTVDENTPKTLYYKLEPIDIQGNPSVNLGARISDDVPFNNQIIVKDSEYDGTYTISGVTTNSFNYNVDTEPETTSYTADPAVLSYTTNSPLAYGPIAEFEIKDERNGYSKLPGISTIATVSGTGAVLNPSSTSIGKVAKTTLSNIGFNYPADKTLFPTAKLPQVLEVSTFYRFESIGITSFGFGYNTPPNLIVLDGITEKKIDDIELKYNSRDPVVEIIRNSQTLSNATPTILPIENSNGVRIRDVEYNAAEGTVKLTTQEIYSEDFPISIGDKILVENVSVSAASTASVTDVIKGFNSDEYDYKLFEVIDVNENLGGNLGIITYRFDPKFGANDVIGDFDPVESGTVIIPQKYFPIFDFEVKSNTFQKGNIVKSGSVSGVIADWDPTYQMLTVETDQDFIVGEVVEEDVTNSKATIIKKYDFDGEYLVDYYSLVNNGWRSDSGFISKNEQKLPDNDYYQNFSYSIKSKIPFQDWNDVVSSLVHSAGFKKFSDLQVESELPEIDQSTLRIDPTDATTVSIDLVSVYDLECVANFDYATENHIGSTRKFSDEINFKTRIISDFIESKTNRVLLIDDIAPQFDSNQRSTPFEEVARIRTEDSLGAKFVVLAKDRTFTGERMMSLVTVLTKPASGEAYINQYADVDTVLDLGDYDFVLEGSEGVLNFYPHKFERNNYNLSVFTYGLDSIGTKTLADQPGAGSTTVGVSSAVGFPGGLVSIAATNHIISGTTMTEVFTLSGIGTTIANTKAAKILFSIENSNEDTEFDEFSFVTHGSNVEVLEYGQLTSHTASASGGPGIGTYEVVKSNNDIIVRYTPVSGVTTTYVTALSVGFSSESYVGVGTSIFSHAKLKAKADSIAASGSPVAHEIMTYGSNAQIGLDGGYGILVVTDTTNGICEMSEFVVIDDDTDPEMTQYAFLDSTTATGSASGLGTLGASRSGNVTSINFTPDASIDVTYNVFFNPVSVEEILDVEGPSEKDLITAKLKSSFDTYTGTKNSIKRAFNLTHKNDEIFRRVFDGSNAGIVDTSSNTINLPNHFFVSGQKINYSTSLGIKTDFIGIAQTDAFALGGIALTTYLPRDLFAIKVDDNNIQVAASATDALAKNPVAIGLTGVGIGNSHVFTAEDANTKVILTIDNMIQSPISDTRVSTILSKAADITEGTIELSGITSFFAGDYVRVGAADTGEVMKIISVGVGDTNVLKVERGWVGTSLKNHPINETVTNLRGNYNIVGNTVHFVEAPHGAQPLASITNPPSSRDWTGISTSSSFSGRSFMRNNHVGATTETYSRNFLFDDVSPDFDGSKRLFTLTEDGNNITGITSSTLVLINGVYQGIGVTQNYTVQEEAGISSIRFVGTAASVAGDVNTANVPIGGVIISVASSEGFGYQPLVAAGGTAIIGVAGTIQSISIGNSGSGYRSGLGTVFVGVGSTSLGRPNIVAIGTAIIDGGHVVSIAMTDHGLSTADYRDQYGGYTNDNLPYVVIDPPQSYTNIPLIYESNTGVGTEARVDIVVGNGSSVIDFEITNTGFGYGAGETLTIGIGGTVGIPTDPLNPSTFRNFTVTIDSVERDEFTGWSVGDFELIDDFSNLFNGDRTRFPIKQLGNSVSFVSKPGSNINVQDNVFVFLNDILQVPGVGYEFLGGSTILFTEPPKAGDTSKFIFYKGSSGVDTETIEVTDTVKVGDDLRLTSQQRKFDQEERVVQEILSTNVVNTNVYPGPGLSDDSSFERTVDWCRQRDDVFINGKKISKARELYEPNIKPMGYIIKSIGIGSTEVYVDNLRPFFNPINESQVSVDFQKKVTIYNRVERVGASATAIINTDGEVDSIDLTSGGVGYSTSPAVTIQTPVGLGTTQRATATATISAEGVVTGITVTGVGTQYSGGPDAPVVLIEPPAAFTEKEDIEDNTIVSYSGDFGVVTGFGTTTVGVASTGIFFDLHIERLSPLRDNTAVTPQTFQSGIQTGDYFLVYDSNINAKLGAGVGITALEGGEDHSQKVVGIGSTYADCIYRVAHWVGFTTGAIGYGLTECRRVTVSVVNNENVGFGTSSFFGRFSWGKMLFSERVGVNSFSAHIDNGAVGIKTGPYIIRQTPMKDQGFIV